ncbi:hypothetical protein Kpol_495p1, partial [Vanderwaltozyma polyspora DSM 70294]
MDSLSSSNSKSWEELCPLLERNCHDSLLSKRIPFLQQLQQLIKSETLEFSDLSYVSAVLLNTYSIYQDAKSKNLVVSIFKSILDLEPRLLENYSKFILKISSEKPGSKAVVDYLNLLEWVDQFILFITRDIDSFKKNIELLIQSHIFLTHGIESALDNQENIKQSHAKQNQHRRRIRQSILQSSVKTFVKCFKLNTENNVLILSSILELTLKNFTKLNLPTSGAIFIIGSLSQSCTQLLSSQPKLHHQFKENYVTECSAFIGKEVILGKNVPSPFCLEISLSPFLYEFVTLDLFNTHFLPNLEKAILRAPESSLETLNELYSAVNSENIDILKIHTSSKLMTQCFSSLKSSKENVRIIALTTILTVLTSSSSNLTTSETLSKFIAEVFKNIKSNLNADYKTTASIILYHLPRYYKESSNEVVKGLTQYVSKESNEAALKQMLDAFFVHYFYIEDTIEETDKTISNGFNEKKPAIKKIWFISFLTASVHASKDILLKFGDKCIEFISETFSHSLKNNHIALLGCFEFIHRIYELGASDIKAKIVDLFKSFNGTPIVGSALLSITLSTSLTSEQRLHSIKLLENIYIREPEIIGMSIISSIEELLKDSDDILIDEFSYKYITPVFNAISVRLDNTDISSKILISELLISQSEKFKLKNGWAGLVQHAQQDPSQIVQANAIEIIDKIANVLSNPKFSGSDFANCALKSAAYSSFVNPAAIVGPLSELIKTDLNTTALSKLTTQDFEIFNTAEGELVVNVLEKNLNNKLADKNSKDYETLKWEQNIRKEQAKKSVKKLTKEEQALVNEQLSKESEIRANVTSIKLKLQRGIQLIKQLANDSIQVDNGRETWYPVAVTQLLNLLGNRNSYYLVQESAIHTFLDLSNSVTSRLDQTRFFIGLATLRVHSISNIPENYLEEPLLDLLSRILFRIKFVSDQLPLDATSLTYLLPLLTTVFEEGKKVAIKNADKPVSRNEFVEEDKEEEQLLLALDIIAAHAEAFEDPSIPRVPILKVLLSLMLLASKAKIARDCFMALSQTISVSPTKEDLEILLQGVLSPNEFVRSTILEAIDNEFELEPFMKYSIEVYICKFDSHDSIRSIADFIWEFSHFEVSQEMIDEFFSYFNQEDSGIRLFAARGYVAAVNELNKKLAGSLESNLNSLLQFYSEKSKPLEPIVDDFGLVVVTAAERKDPWEERSTAAIALKEMAQLLSDSDKTVVNTIQFLVEEGALGDRNLLVRQEMKEAGIAIIDTHGSGKVEELIPIFDKSLTSSTEIDVRENVIILYGSLARHLNETDSRIHTIVERLVATLDTPSTDVQQAIAECIAPLVVLFKPKVSNYIDVLMAKLLDTNSNVMVRKGAAWGIAGFVKGYGISSLSEFDIIRNLIEAAEDKKDQQRREAAAYVFEYLSKLLGKFFEPYVIEVLPNILKNLGDSVPEVRHTTAEATKVIMSHTTSFGVKKLIPVAISNLDEISWRTKRGSVELLGNMAYLDPTQLSNSLSTIVPEIVAVLNDSHKEVRKSADESLKRFGEVIRNPEIQKLVPTLIKAIGDPTKYTEEALDSLIQTQFVHYIDGPSLALIIHVIHRGMHDRSANTKRKACKIVGNMAILVDTKDLVPYLQQLIDEVEIAMVDPVPNTRGTAARALGALVERLGEDQFPGLIPRLFDT